MNIDYPIEISKVNAVWTDAKGADDLTLRNLSLRLRRGKLCAIIGPVGSGKVSHDNKKFVYI